MDTVALKAGILQGEGGTARVLEPLAPLRPGADNLFTAETQAYQAILERHPSETGLLG